MVLSGADGKLLALVCTPALASISLSPSTLPQAVPAFAVAAAPVTVGQFRRFVFGQRGYQRAELWEPGALEHVRAAGRCMPVGWSLQATGGGGGDGAGAQQLWVHLPEGSYYAEEVEDCPVYVRWVGNSRSGEQGCGRRVAGPTAL